VESVAQGVSADPGEPVDQGELAGQAVPEVQGESVDQGELAGPVMSEAQGESAGLGELAGVLHPTGWQDHLLGHTTQPRRRSTRQIIRT
jgi:hypothetical protein